jgi:hypothetical protein
VSQNLDERSEIPQPFNNQSNAASQLPRASDLESLTNETKDNGTEDDNADLSLSLKNYDDKSIVDTIKGTNSIVLLNCNIYT